MIVMRTGCNQAKPPLICEGCEPLLDEVKPNNLSSRGFFWAFPYLRCSYFGCHGLHFEKTRRNRA